MPRLPRRLQMARPAKLSPEASPHRSPTVPWSPTSNEGVTSTSPRVTSASIVPSARPMRSRNSTTSSRAMKAGKLAKPSVATATPPTLTAMKKVIQCTASRKPLASTMPARRGPSPCSSGLRCARASTSSAVAANPALPAVMATASKRMRAPRMPVSPKSTATPWAAASALTCGFFMTRSLSGLVGAQDTRINPASARDGSAACCRHPAASSRPR